MMHNFSIVGAGHSRADPAVLRHFEVGVDVAVFEDAGRGNILLFRKSDNVIRFSQGPFALGGTNAGQRIGAVTLRGALLDPAQKSRDFCSRQRTVVLKFSYVRIGVPWWH